MNFSSNLIFIAIRIECEWNVWCRADKGTGNPGYVIVPQYDSSKITVFVWGKNTILKFVGNTKYKSMKLTLQLVVVVLIAPTKFSW